MEVLEEEMAVFIELGGFLPSISLWENIVKIFNPSVSVKSI